MVNKKRIMRNNLMFLASVILMLLGASFAFSQEASVEQKDKWIKFSSPEGRFAVELPEAPEQRTRVARLPDEEETEEIMFIFRCTRSKTAYTLRSISRPKISRLAIMEVDVSKCERQKGDFVLDMFRFIILYGGDEAATAALSEGKLTDVKLNKNGLQVRDFILTRGSEIRSRVLAVDAGKWIFVVLYDRKKGSLEEEERIFKTFRLKYLKRELKILE